MATLLLRNGTVYDPAHGISGECRDLWIVDGKIVAPPADPTARAERVIDASGLVVMPGGIDMHCHIAGPKVNAARKMLPEDRRRAEPMLRTDITRSGTIGSVPSTFTTGYLYAGLGYTTAFDAAIPPLTARHAHEEFYDTPMIDKGFLVLAGNNHFVMQRIKNDEPKLVQAYLGWLMNATKGYGIKIVNPGGVENWKCRANGNVKTLDDTVDGFGITPRDIIRGVATAVDDLGLPHPVHIHGNNLGLPGNSSTTLETMKALEGHRGHLTHIQFHSYGGDPDNQSTFRSDVPKLADYINKHSNLTIDVGQVMFGPTISMTGDGPLGYYLHRVMGGKWFSGDIEQEAGCGIVPITYKEKSFVHALQWAVGLEWYLLIEDPWKVAMSTDHPNGASFLAYPQIIALLMDRSRREEAIARLPPRVRETTVLSQLSREYTLEEIAIITRASPARMLGLTCKGHLGPGADADITIYTPNRDIERMFELPRFVIKAGEVLIEQGEIRRTAEGITLQTAPEYDDAVIPSIREWFTSSYTVQYRNYIIEAHEVGPTVVEPTKFNRK
jgi:formylmethanofuran dehydrogenase subunit A